jgi:hypothetical protein
LVVASYLVDKMERSNVADYVIETENRPVAEIAAETLHVAGWLR